MNNNLIQEIILLISDTRDIPLEQMSADTTFIELDIDSLDMMELVFEIEDRYKLSLTCSPAEVETIKDLAEILNKHLDKDKSVV